MGLGFNFLWKRPLLAGVLGGAFLLSVFFGLMLLTNPLSVAVMEFKRLWVWIALLVTGFSIQVYLYAFLKKYILEAAVLNAATAGVAASGGMSGGAMVACCAHHFTDVLPFLGFAAAAAFLSRYQELFLLVGVLSNVIGIVMMLGVFKRMKIGGKCPIVRNFSKKQFDFAFKASVIASIAIVLAYVASSILNK